MKNKGRLLPIVSILTGLLLVLGLSTPASADIALPVDGSVTTTVPGTQTPITLTAGNSSPAMTFTAFGIGLSGVPNSTRFATQIQVRPSFNTTWSTEGWSAKVSCPTTSANATTTLAHCGITAVYINDTDVTSNAKVFVEPTGSSISNTFVINAINGNFIDSIDSVGTVRVELASGAWELAAGANTTRGFSMWVRAFNGDRQGNAYSYQRTALFNANGGTGNSYTQSWTTNAQKALIANQFTRLGYTFSGWNTRQDGTGDSYAPGANYTFSTNQILYAQWTSNSSPAPTPTPQPTTSGEDTLANTGSSTGVIIGLALGAVILGSAMILRRRKPSAS